MNPFENLLVALSRSGVEYVVVGGVAVALCGYTRATYDLDILVEASPENVDRLLACLEGFGEGSARELARDDFTLEEGAIRIVEDFPLDVFTIMRGYTYEDLLPDTSMYELEGTRIRYLAPEGLIRLKKDSLRPKDQLDVMALKEIQQRKKEA